MFYDKIAHRNRLLRGVPIYVSSPATPFLSLKTIFWNGKKNHMESIIKEHPRDTWKIPDRNADPAFFTINITAADDMIKIDDDKKMTSYSPQSAEEYCSWSEALRGNRSQVNGNWGHFLPPLLLIIEHNWFTFRCKNDHNRPMVNNFHLFPHVLDDCFAAVDNISLSGRFASLSTADEKAGDNNNLFLFHSEGLLIKKTELSKW